ncbi:hypothetical protein DB346_09400 [Verrucomicrobia bacterium LW23]|nr:hypothetical protein DB346_09400 [Verrucomicrobia bacterium LW23]
MDSPISSSRRNSGGFTLMELVVVMTIISIVAVLSLTAFGRATESSSLAGVRSTLTAMLELARTHALSSGRTVEIRFYKLPAEKPGYCALQILDYQTSRPLTPLTRMTGNITLLADEAFSSLLSDANPNGGTAPLTNPAITASYKCFRVRPNGSTDLPREGTPVNRDRWCITAAPASAVATPQRPAPNFVTFIIDPLNARTTTFQP